MDHIDLEFKRIHMKTGPKEIMILHDLYVLLKDKKKHTYISYNYMHH